MRISINNKFTKFYRCEYMYVSRLFRLMHENYRRGCVAVLMLLCRALL